MFKETAYISKILEDSENNPVIIFKYSSTCGSSSTLKEKLENAVKEKKIALPIYMITVQETPVLSKKIEEFFSVKHESPQIIIVNNGSVKYSASHNDINIEKFAYTK
ncbi:MAG: general stress protein [Parcubacteria bacterium C7867-003]|nr:MAG: general stress protein [Parcubacteria bacterium C7867-003]